MGTRNGNKVTIGKVELPEDFISKYKEELENENIDEVKVDEVSNEDKEMIYEHELGGYTFKFKVKWDGNKYTIGNIILPEELSGKIEENESEAIADVYDLKTDADEMVIENNIGGYTFKFKVTYDDSKIVLS